jgi:uncharacterized protein (TIGR03000 family)
MLRNRFPCGGILLLVGTAMLAMPGLGWAQHGGGGHFGGAHFSGGHFNGGHFGGARLGGYYGGFSRGAYRSGYAHAYHYGDRSYRGYYPYYGLYGYYPYSYDAYPYVWSDPAYDLGYSGYSPLADSYPYYNAGLQPDLTASGSYEAVAPAYTYESSSTNPPAGSSGVSALPSEATRGAAPAQAVAAAHFTVTVPRGGTLWFDGSKTTSIGPVREFQSPPLRPGSRYTYDIRARWNENGHEVTQSQRVEVTAGAHINVTFPLRAEAAS